MSHEELAETVRQLIGRAQTKEAIDTVIKWAQENNKIQLKKESTILKNRHTELGREMRLGIISNSDASIRQNKIVHSVLELLENVNDENSIQNNTEDNLASKEIKILMLTSNPAKTAILNLDREYATINQKLQQKQKLFNIVLKKAVSGSEFKEFTQQEQPAILHFSGHGETGKYAGIVVQNEDKNERDLISIAGLRSLFKFFKKKCKIKVVVLNACYTQEQAAVISHYVEYVIGTNVAIGDNAASAFSSGFYFQLAEDADHMNIEDAFDSGRTEAVMKGADEKNFVIYRQGKLIEIT